MSEFALDAVCTETPVTILVDIWAHLWLIIEQVRRSSEILLAVSVVAALPVVRLVKPGTYLGLESINHKFFATHLLFIVVNVCLLELRVVQ